MNANLNFKGKQIEVGDIKKCEGLKKYTGLMFRTRNTDALLFDFGAPCLRAIHSLFCPSFLAVWINENKIVDYRLVAPWQFKIVPKEEFTKLLEIPLNEKYSGILDVYCNSDEKEKV